MWCGQTVLKRKWCWHVEKEKRREVIRGIDWPRWLLSSKPIQVVASLNFSEAGHGKGAADGIGGIISALQTNLCQKVATQMAWIALWSLCQSVRLQLRFIVYCDRRHNWQYFQQPQVKAFQRYYEKSSALFWQIITSQEAEATNENQHHSQCGT